MLQSACYPGYLDNLFVRSLAITLNVLTVKPGAAIVETICT
jgi:hypothetical protein